MTWRATDPEGWEQRKTRWRAAPWTRGKGLDLGCGQEKIMLSKHCIGVDNYKDTALFGVQMKPDVECDVTDLAMFASGQQDYVFSSHTLEHIPYGKVPDTLREWGRVLKQGGKLILYLPASGEYPDIGQPGANHDHKWNVTVEMVMGAMERVGFGWDLVEYELCNKEMEYSHWFVFKKLKNPHTRDQSWKVDKNPDKKRTACLVRFGAYGDVVQAASIAATLKKEGYHVTFIASYPSSEIIAFDPNVDRLITLGQDQMPLDWLGHFFVWWKQKFDKFINLTQSAEVTLLSTEGSVTFSEWSPAARHRYMNHNYMQLQAELGRVDYAPSFKFVPHQSEIDWCRKELKKMEAAGIRNKIMWSLAGSARTHKLWPFIDQIFQPLLNADRYRDWGIITVGDGACKELEEGFEVHPRIWRTSGQWTMRQVLTMMEQCQVVVGPETGVLQAAAFYDMPKLMFLSHSTKENLTRDWKNTASLYAPETICPGRGQNEAPACHMMLPTWNGCRRSDITGVAQCATEIHPEWVWYELQLQMMRGKATEKWEPPTVPPSSGGAVMARAPMKGPMTITQGNAARAASVPETEFST